MENAINRKIEIKAPVAKVWKALTDHKQFGEWFGASFDKPFANGANVECILNHACGGAEYTGLKLKLQIIEINEQKRYFSYKWHPFAVDKNYDYDKEEPTLVEFTLKEIAGGTELTVKESGFSKIPESRRAEAFRANSGGWESQLQNIRNHAEK